MSALPKPRERTVSMLDPSRTPTKPMEPMLAGTIEVDLSDSEQAALFLEMAAKVIRAKRRIRLTVE